MEKINRWPSTFAAAFGIAWVFGAFGVYYHLCRPMIARMGPLDYLYLSKYRTPAWLLQTELPWLGFPWEILRAAFLLLLTAASLCIIGRWLYRRRSEAGSIEACVWGCGLALGAFATFIFALGLVGLLQPAKPIFGALLGALAVGGAFLLLKEFLGKTKTKNACIRAPLSKAEWATLILLGAVQALALLYALTPSVQSDALRYHLAAPQEWLKAGRLIYLPYNSHASFPSTIEMLFLFGLGLDGDLLAKGFHFIFLPLSAGAVGLLADELTDDPTKRIATVRPAILAAALWGASPLTAFIAGWAFIDLAITFYTLGVVFFLLRWFRRRRPSDWILAGVFGGILVASKYTGVLTIIFGATLLATLGAIGGEAGFTRSFPKALKRAVLFGLIAASIGSPWWIKNVVHTGNPVYPLAWSVFGGGEWDQTCVDIHKEKIAEKGMGPDPIEWREFIELPPIAKKTLKEKGMAPNPRDWRSFVRLPWTTARYSEHFGGFEPGIFYWLFFPWIGFWCLRALYRFRRHPGETVLSLFLAFMLVTWFFTYQSNRFLMSFFGLATAMTVVLLAETASSFRLPGILRRLTAIAAALALLHGVGQVAGYLFLDGGKIAWVDISTNEAKNQADRDALFEQYPTACFYQHNALRPRLIRIVEGINVLWPAYTLGFLSRDDYLTQPAVAYYPAARYCGENLGPRDKILFVGEHRKMHWKCNVESNDWYDPPRIRSYLRGAKSIDDTIDAMIADGFTHVFFNFREWGYSLEKGFNTFGAGFYNAQHFTKQETVLLKQFIQSKRLKRVSTPDNLEDLYLCRIQARYIPITSTSDDIWDLNG